MDTDAASTIPPITKIYTSGVIAERKLAVNVPKLGNFEREWADT
jgi:hypothetical protein